MENFTMLGKVVIFKRDYKNKFFVPFRIWQPLVMIFDGVINILLLPTPYESNLHSIYLRVLIKKQMNKRIKNYEK